MATALSVTIFHQLKGKRVDSADLSFGDNKFDHSTALTLTHGTGVNQADVSWSDTRTLVASGSEVLNLVTTLTNLYGQVATFAKLKAIKVSTPPSNTHDIIVTRHASLGVPIFTEPGAGVLLPPGAEWSMQCGGIGGLCSVVGGSSNLLTILNPGASASVEYSITLVGTSI